MVAMKINENLLILSLYQLSHIRGIQQSIALYTYQLVLSLFSSIHITIDHTTLSHHAYIIRGLKFDHSAGNLVFIIKKKSSVDDRLQNEEHVSCCLCHNFLFGCDHSCRPVLPEIFESGIGTYLCQK